MAEPFLEEQLRRIREMTRQMSRVRALREAPGTRNQGSHDERSSAHDEPAPARPHAPRVPNRRRGR
jgi:hypothetical protein